MRKTKIVCTMGPSVMKPGILRKMIKAGMNVARFNFSHGDHLEHKTRIDEVKKLRDEFNKPIALLLDTKGPEIRIKTFEHGEIKLVNGEYFTLTTEDVVGNIARVSITYPELPKYVKKGDKILINDGMIELVVDTVDRTQILTKVVHGGHLSNRKSMNLPGKHIDMPYMSEQDMKDIKFGVEQDVDYIAMSFVRDASDVRVVREYIARFGGQDIKLIAKIENQRGVDHIEEILDAADGIMVARGDMGVEISFEKLPPIQKTLIKKCYEAGKMVITATQMLETMTHNPRPTRAETSDVANAVFDGTSATMLSGETAQGDFPVEVVLTMVKIIEHAEKAVEYNHMFDEKHIKYSDISQAISHSACSAAKDLNAKAIIATTRSGRTARQISRFRVNVPIIAATTKEKTYHQLSLNWGVIPVRANIKEDTDELFYHALDCAKTTELLKKGDVVVMTAGVPIEISGLTNVLRIETVK